MQRYPWNGVVDVQYRANFWPDSGVQTLTPLLEIKVGAIAVTNRLDFAGQIGTFTGVANFDLSTLAPNTQTTAKFKAFVVTGN